jgi:hypothetical protein
VKDIHKMPDDTPADEPSESRGGYSPPCYLREVDPAYAGYLTKDELVAILNELLEGERAGARAATLFVTEGVEDGMDLTLHRIARDEARFCAMLSRHIRELGGKPSPATGAFYDKLVAISGFPERLAFLNRGQGWVVRKLRDVLPRVRDDRLHGDLKVMLEVHEGNIRRCDRLLNSTQPRSGPPQDSPA